jgi:hypothetical protein
MVLRLYRRTNINSLMELRNGDDDMEMTSSLKFWKYAANHGYARKLIVNHLRLINSVKSYLKKSRYFNSLFGVRFVHYIYDPFTLIIIMRSQTSLTDWF